MDSVVLTEALPEHIDSIATLESLCFSCPMTGEMLSKLLKNDNALIIAACDSEGLLLGYAGMLTVLDEAEVLNVAVIPQARGRGVGKKLMDELFSRCRNGSIASLSLEVRQSNMPAISLYEKLGFETVGIRKNYYEKPRENAIIMRKAL